MEIFFTRIKNGFEKFINQSQETFKLIDGTYRELNFLFESNKLPESIKLPYLNKEYSKRDIKRIRSFYFDHIIRGKKHCDFVQSNKLIKNPLTRSSNSSLFFVFLGISSGSILLSRDL